MAANTSTASSVSTEEPAALLLECGSSKRVVECTCTRSNLLCVLEVELRKIVGEDTRYC